MHFKESARRAISFLLSVSMMAVWIAVPSYAADTSTGADPSAVPATASTQKFLISTPTQWQELAQKINDPATYDAYASLYYQITQDIDFNNEPVMSIGTKDYPFTGTLDGQNHTLRGINMVDYRKDDVAQAPISVADGALVKDLTLENLSLSANSKVSAGLIGTANNTTVENVALKQVNFYFHHEDISGGLIGILTGNSVVRNCAVDIQQVGSLDVMGGLIGKTEGNTTVDGCWVRLDNFYQSNSSVETCAGGIVGQTAGALQIKDCNVSNISYIQLQAKHAGGILGNVAAGGSASIYRSIVAVMHLYGSNVAGIANGASTIENCVNISAKINGTAGQTPLRIGNADTESGNFAWGDMEFLINGSNQNVPKPTSGAAGQGATLTLAAAEWLADGKAWNWDSAGYTAANGWQVPTTPGVPVLKALPSSLPQASSLPAWITLGSSYTYTIGTVEELQAFAAYINSGEPVTKDNMTYPAYGVGVTFKLTADLDMGGVAWTPIGKDEAHPFRGIFTGAARNDYDNKITAKAYSISNLNGPLFGVIEGGNANANNGANATVSSFALVNQTVNVPEGPAGGVACIAKNVYMNYCLVQGTVSVSGSGAVGGLIGKAEGVFLTTCAYIGASSYSNPTLKSSGGSVGGIVGESVGKTIRNCLVYNANLQTTGGNAVGGIVGTESMTVIDSNYSMAYELSNGGQTTEKVGRIVGVFTDDNSSGSVTAANGGWRGMQLNGSAISDNGTNRHQGIDLVYADGKLKMAKENSVFNLYGDSWSTPVYGTRPTELTTMPELYGSYFYENYKDSGYTPIPLAGQSPAFPDYITKNTIPAAVNITSEAELIALREGVNSGAASFKVGDATIDKAGAEGYSFILTKDIYLYNSWMPIGTKEHPFLASSLDGSGHSIENLKVDTNDVLPYAGLIGVMGSGKESGSGHYTIRNLTLTRCKICPETIDDVHFTAAGGLIGLVQSTINVNVTGCSILGEDGNNDISDSKYVGGLVGQVAQNASLALNACRVDMASVGGIIPPFGNVDDSYSYAAGGLVGRAEPGSNVGIDGSAFTGSVDSTAAYIGGLVGGGDNAEVLIKNSYAYAKMISLQTFSGKLYAGGILGAGNEYSKVNNRLAWGDISYGGLNAGLDYLGGIAGSSAPSVQNCVALQNSLTGPKAAQLQPGNATVGSANNLAFNGSTSKGEKQGTQIYTKEGVWYADAACTERLVWDGVLNGNDPDITGAPKVWTFTADAYRLPKLPVMPVYPQMVSFLPVMLSSITFKNIPAQTYTGQPITPAPVLAYGINPITAGRDYTVSYSNNLNAGTATVTIVALSDSNCFGSLQVDFVIAPAALTAVPTLADKVYDGTNAAAIKSIVWNGLVNGETLEDGVDYTAAAVFDAADVSANAHATVTFSPIADSAKMRNYRLTDNTVTAIAAINAPAASDPTAGGLSDKTNAAAAASSQTGDRTNLPLLFTMLSLSLTAAAVLGFVSARKRSRLSADMETDTEIGAAQGDSPDRN